MAGSTARLIAVVDRFVGSSLTEAIPAGVGVLPVSDGFDFDEGGGTLSIEGQSYEYAGHGESTVLLVEPTLVAYGAGVRVLVEPATSEKTAIVQFAGQDDTDEARIRHTDYALFPEGIRDLPDQVAVRVEKVGTGSGWVVVDAYATPKKFDGGVIDPESTIPPEALSDGLPPTTAPVVSAAPFAVRSVRVSIVPPPNPDPLRPFEVQFSAVSPVVDGDPIEQAGGTSWTHDTDGTVFARVRAVDADGPGPWSVEVSATSRVVDYETVSAEIRASLDNADTLLEADAILARIAAFGSVASEDIATDFLAARSAEIIDLFVQRLRSEVNEVGDSMVFDGPTSTITVWKDSTRNDVLFQVGPEGAINRVPMDTDGISAMGALILKSALSRLDPGAVMTLSAGGVPDPSQNVQLSTGTKPAATLPAVPTGFRQRGINWDATDGCWVRLLVSTASDIAAKCRVEKIGTSGASLGYVTLGNIIGIGEDDLNSVVRVGSSYYVCVYDTASPASWYVAKFAVATGAFQQLSAGYASITGRPCVGTNAVGDAVFWHVFSDEMRFHNLNPTTLASAFLGIYASDWDGSTILLGYGEQASYGFSFTPTLGQAALITATTIHAIDRTISPALTPKPGDDITLSADSAQGGAGYRPGYGWHSISSSSRTLESYRPYINPGGEKAWVSHADRDAAGKTTKDSAVQSILVPNHRWVIADLPNPASAATEQWAYMGLGTTLPSDANLKHRTEPIVGRRIFIDPSSPGGAAVPAANTFPGGSPGSMKSEASNGWELGGDGRTKFRPPVLPDEPLTGTGVAYASITPTVGNAAATCAARMMKLGKRTEINGVITFTGAATGTITLTFPSTPRSDTPRTMGVAQLRDASVGNGSRTVAMPTYNGTTAIFQIISATPNLYANATTPWTWATGDTIDFSLTYEDA